MNIDDVRLIVEIRVMRGRVIIILIVDMMTNSGLEFMSMIIHPWLSDSTQHTSNPIYQLPT